MTSRVKNSHSPVARVACSLPYKTCEQSISYESPYTGNFCVRFSDQTDSTLTILASFTATTDKDSSDAPRYDVVGVWVDSMLNRATLINASHYALFMKNLREERDADAPYLICIGIEGVETFPAIPLTIDKIANAKRLFKRGIGLQKNETSALLRCAKDAEKEGKVGPVDLSERHTLASLVRRWGDGDITKALGAFKDELLQKRP